MAVEAVKSAGITNLDAVPPLANTQGEGAKFSLECVDDWATVPASASAASTFRLVRIPTTCKVKQVLFESEAQAAGATDIGLYYSSSVNDSPAALAKAGAVIDADFFASAVALTNASGPTDVTNEGGFYTLNERSLPIWKAVGLSADPGGFFDVVATLSTAVTTGTGKIGCRVSYSK